MSEIIVISLGGSLIFPEYIDVEFLKEFKKIILKHVNLGKRFIIVTGGGKIARNYQTAANEISGIDDEDLDWLGIHATRYNGHLIRTIFKEYSNPKVIRDPTKEIDFNEKILVAAGWKPGFSSDYDAVLLAKQFGVKKVVNLSNIKYVYDKDPRNNKDAKPLKEISWVDFRKIVGDSWDPGLNMPFDPIASKEAEKENLTVFITNGKDMKNLDKLLSSEEFEGTIIS